MTLVEMEEAELIELVGIAGDADGGFAEALRYVKEYRDAGCDPMILYDSEVHALEVTARETFFKYLN